MTTRIPGLAALSRVELALPPDDLLFRALTDGARVDDDEVCRLHRWRLGAAGREQSAGHLLRVAPVHLAAQGPHVESRQGQQVRGVLGQPRHRPVRRAGAGRPDAGGGAISSIGSARSSRR